MIHKAFILGAGLGTRLQPLTHVRPKPLVPIFHEPMANFALRHCQSVGISRFAINTHHLPKTWDTCYPNATYKGSSLEFFHEPTLLDTGGGIRNISSFIENDPILIYNGDILTNIDIQSLIDNHLSSGNVATLALRSSGQNCNVNLEGNHVSDMRNILNSTPGTHQFTGVYCINPEILDFIPNEEIVSIMPAFIELIQNRQLGAVVLDDGDWFDIGTPDAYSEIHHYLRNHPFQGLNAPAIHPDAIIHPSASINHQTCIIGPHANIHANAHLDNCIVWPHAEVKANASHIGEIICQ